MTEATTTKLGLRRRTSLPVDAAIAAITDALKTEGFGVLTTIDVQATLKQKIGEDVEPYTILGACNPRLAHQALAAEPEIGLLLPCNVVVRRHGGETLVEAVDPTALLGIVHKPELKALGAQASEKIQRALDQLPA